MAEPFSIAAAAVGLLDASTTFTRYLLDLRKGAQFIEKELEDLAFLIKSCEQTVQAIEKTHQQVEPASKPPDDSWMELAWMIGQSKDLILNLQTILRDICGSSDNVLSRHLEAWKQARRRLSKNNELQHHQRTLEFYQRAMSIILQRIDQQGLQQSQNATASSLDAIQDQVGALQSQVSDLSEAVSPNSASSAVAFNALRRLRTSIQPHYPRNIHFSTPQSVQSFFTGRTATLQELTDTFIQPSWPSHDRSQRRFVIQGISGSGKTQFCCKFADMNRYRFWGVFSVDGSSDVAIRKSLSEIARIPGRDAHFNAALDWLSNVEERWLLLIDNADDGSVELERYFPRGRGGHILITTRNPKFKIHGNIGRGHYNFSGLQGEEASDLLLKAASLPMPWRSSWFKSASKITKALGYLALAIVHAGAAIRDQLCELDEYLDWFDRHWRKLRSTAVTSQGSDSQRAVFVTFELCFRRLEERSQQSALDAKQVLRLLAFFAREGFTVEIISRAMSNAQFEGQDEKKTGPNGPNQEEPELASWSETLRTMLFRTGTWVLSKDTQPPLPRLISDGRKPGGFEDSLDRARRALQELSHLSLISYNQESDAYVVHPLVHKWARERLWNPAHPHIHLADQALWAEMAGQVLAASILLPPLGNTASDELYNKRIHSHIEHVQAFQGSIDAEMLTNATLSRFKWLPRNIALDQNRVQMLAKFSVVYAQCGDVQKAQPIMETVTHFLSDTVGLEDSRTRLAKSALASMYEELDLHGKALELRLEVARACEEQFGQEHPNTCTAWGGLGLTYWQQGNYWDALHWHRKAVAGLSKCLGNEHPSTLGAIVNLGRTVASSGAPRDLEEAFNMHAEAVRGMEKIQHPRVDDAKESLARDSAMLGRNLSQALEHMDDVIDIRTKRKGKEAPWTLMAKASRCCVLGAMGRLEEAHDIMVHVLAIAKRNGFGENHIGYQQGRLILASIIYEMGRYHEAEEVLRDTAEHQETRGVRHGNFQPEGIATMNLLARCLQEQGKLEQSIKFCDVAIEGIESKTSEAHPAKDDLLIAKARMEEIRARKDGSRLDQVTIRFPVCIFKRLDPGEVYGEGVNTVHPVTLR